ncbi:hypothetical protein F5888DRAFT_1607712 [Russula emetica]|nr:hypothetical protein F5888DRAFT_1607712 [Russula emetica]
MPSSIKPSAAFLTLLLAAGQRALAVNDWSVPCTQGKCSWDLPVESNSSGSVNIWGPVSAISDITPAAGWQIMTKCNPTSSKQDIQLMCKDNNPDCNHLFQDNGAVNTIVRLPESCGPMPFARVAQYQVLQSNLATRGNGSEAPVHQLTLDTDFAAASPSQGGEVHFSVQGQNVRDNSGAVNRRSQRRSRSLARSQNHVYRQVLQGSDSDLSIPTFNRTLSGNPDPIGFSGQRNLFSDGSGSININTNLQASVGISTVAMGKIVPPTVTQFGITFVLDGNADAKLSVSGDLSGKVSSGNIPLFQAGFPGFSIPNILDIGPQFTLVGLIDANFGLANVNAAVEVNYDLGGASFTFPAQGGSNTNGITSSSKQVTFNASFNSGATLNASAHLIPQVSLGINALSGAASANISLDFDASLGLQGTVSPAANSQPCLSGNAQINVRLGALGSFFGLFSASTGGSPFNNNFPLFQVRAHSLLYTFFFFSFKYLSFLLRDDSNASTGTRIRRIRRLSLARQPPLRPIRLLRLARPMPLRPIRLPRLAHRVAHRLSHQLFHRLSHWVVHRTSLRLMPPRPIRFLRQAVRPILLR